MIEQDHRFIKKRITASLGFRSPEAALRTIDGYEAMHGIRKGQVRWLAKGECAWSASIHPYPLRYRCVNPTDICLSRSDLRHLQQIR
jgi:hypothetical protein